MNAMLGIRATESRGRRLCGLPSPHCVLNRKATVQPNLPPKPIYADINRSCRQRAGGATAIG